MRDEDRETLAEHGRQLADLQESIGRIEIQQTEHGRRLDAVETRLDGIETTLAEHGRMLARLLHHLGVPADSAPDHPVRMVDPD